MLENIRRWKPLRNTKNNQEGFTLLEVVMTVPLVAVTGGLTIYLIGQSLSIISLSETANNAGKEIQAIADNVQNARNCYDLNNLVGEKQVEQKSDQYDFTVYTSLASECVPGNIATVEVYAERNNDGHTLFTTTTEVFISE